MQRERLDVPQFSACNFCGVLNIFSAGQLGDVNAKALTLHDLSETSCWISHALHLLHWDIAAVVGEICIQSVREVPIRDSDISIRHFVTCIRSFEQVLSIH